MTTDTTPSDTTQPAQAEEEEEVTITTFAKLSVGDAFKMKGRFGYYIKISDGEFKTPSDTINVIGSDAEVEAVVSGST
jgi:hypothetical protein